MEKDREAYLGGVDGLYAIGDRLVGLQNITTPPRVFAADVGKDLRACVRVLASAHPRLAQMTTAAVVGGRVAVLSRTGVGGDPPKAGDGPALVWLDLPKRACG